MNTSTRERFSIYYLSRNLFDFLGILFVFCYIRVNFWFVSSQRFLVLRYLYLMQEQLDDIIRYGSKELFADDNDESVKSRQIHYDETAIDR